MSAKLFSIVLLSATALFGGLFSGHVFSAPLLFGATAAPSSNLLKDQSPAEGVNATNTLRWLQYGPPRTATTLQFQTLCYAMITKYLAEPHQIEQIHCDFGDLWKGPIGVSKSHTFPSGSEMEGNFVIFATSTGGTEGTYNALQTAGFVVPYVADTSMVAAHGHVSVREYQAILEMTDKEMDVLVEAIRYWDILRLCCGKQMSEDWRNRLYPKQNYTLHRSTQDPGYHGCEMYNISKVEENFRSTVLYTAIARFGHLKPMLRPSRVDGDLDGTYCERYNAVLRSSGIGFNDGIPAAAEEPASNGAPTHHHLSLDNTYPPNWSSMSAEQRESWLKWRWRFVAKR